MPTSRINEKKPQLLRQFTRFMLKHEYQKLLRSLFRIKIVTELSYCSPTTLQDTLYRVQQKVSQQFSQQLLGI